MTLPYQVARAYWNEEETARNAPANKERGNAFVDGLTLGQLAAFFDECKTGPTYCMVARYVHEMLKKFPPHIESKKERTIAAVDSAVRAFKELRGVVDELNETMG